MIGACQVILETWWKDGARRKQSFWPVLFNMAKKDFFTGPRQMSELSECRPSLYQRASKKTLVLKLFFLHPSRQDEFIPTIVFNENLL